MIVNNGAAVHCGHYLENALAVAEEAHSQGLDVVLAVHAHLPPFEKPDWLECLPIFRVDTWSQDVAARVPNMFGLRHSQKALTQATMEHVLAGTSTLTDYLMARFEPLTPAPGIAPQQELGPLATPSRKFERIISCLKQALPPLMYQALCAVHRRRHWAIIAAQAMTPPVVWNLLREARSRERWFRKDQPSLSPESLIPAQEVQIRGLGTEAILRAALAAVGSAYEFDLMRTFQEDLERLLCLADLGPEDHVYLPAAHGREAFGIRQWIDTNGAHGAPTFHLRFLHGLADLETPENACEDPWRMNATQVLRAFFEGCGRFRDNRSMCLYTETAELQADYSQLAQQEFGIQPLHFRPRMIRPSLPRSPGPLRILYLGDTREDKGFHLLPGC